MPHDFYCYGMISPSTVFVLREDFMFPAANQYAEIRKTIPSIGGEAANSAIVLSRLGAGVKLDGNWMNPVYADQIRNLLGPFHIDISRLAERQGYGTEEVVISDKVTRTVFGNYAAFHAGEKQWNDPDEEDIKTASCAALDPYFREESRLAAALCVKHHVPYVTLDCRYDDAMARHAAAVSISHELRDQDYPDEPWDGLFKKYQDHCSGLVVFTFGSDALWYGRRNGPVQQFEPYPVIPVDTTGAGDAFRGALAYGVLNKWEDKKIVGFASAVAACVCLTMPHALNAPTLEQVHRFIKENPGI
ncbi:carbohydrate kinase family protein [bacterium]|nr:carbohydrate kinase family protein [bacterium]